MMDVGIDVGGTNLRAGVVDEQGKLLSRVSQPVGTLKSPEELIRRLAELAQKAVEDAGTPEKQIQSVGVGIPGAVSEGNILYTCNLPLRDVPFEQLFRRFFDRPVYLENDANCAAAGEWLYGAGRGRKNFVMVTLGTGLGGGFILNGKLYDGGGMAGEIGHMVIVDSDEVVGTCGCGHRGCLEQVASATGIVNLTEKKLAECSQDSVLRDISPLTAKDVLDAAKAGDALAEQAAENMMKHLGRAAAYIACVVNPDIFVIGGGVSKAGEYLIEGISRYYKDYAFHASADTKFALASLGNDAGMIGAAGMVCTL